MARSPLAALRGFVALPLSVAVLLAAGCGTTGRIAPGPSGSAPGTSAPPGGASGAAPTAAHGPGASSSTRFAPFFEPDGTAVLSPTPVAIQAGDFYFRPDALTIRRGKRAKLAITNVSSQVHTFELPALGVHRILPAGRTETVDLSPTRAGTYYFWCPLPGQADAGMVGRLTVR